MSPKKEPMKRDFTAQLLDPLGEPIPFDEKPKKDADGNDLPPRMSTYADYATGALLAALPQQGTDYDKILKHKTSCYKLAMRIFQGGVTELSAEDLKLIKDQVAIVWPPLIVGRMTEFLESDGPAGQAEG